MRNRVHTQHFSKTPQNKKTQRGHNQINAKPNKAWETFNIATQIPGFLCRSIIWQEKEPNRLVVRAVNKLGEGKLWLVKKPLLSKKEKYLQRNQLLVIIRPWFWIYLSEAKFENFASIARW